MSENRCKRCNRRLTNPSATYGSTCARIMGVREAYEQSGKDTRDDFDHSAHVTADKLQMMGVNWANEDGQILYRQLFAQEFGKSPQVVPAKDSKGAIEQTIRDRDTDYEIHKLSSGQTVGGPKATEPGAPVNYQTTGQSAVRAMEHVNAYDENMTQAQKDAWMVEYRKLLKEVEWEYSEENLKNRAYDSVMDIRIEYDRIYYLHAYAMRSWPGGNAKTERFPDEVRQETLAVVKHAMYNMEKDMVARTIIKEAAGENPEDMKAVAQVMINRYNMSLGQADGSGDGVPQSNFYRTDYETMELFDKNFNKREREWNSNAPHQSASDILPGLYQYCEQGEKGFYMYTMGGMLLGSGEFSGLTGGNNNVALNPYDKSLNGHKSQAEIDLAYKLAEEVMRGRNTHDGLAKTGWYSYRGNGRGIIKGRTLTIDGKSYTNSPGKNDKWILIGENGNFYIAYDNPD